jgi:hypothetical protein
LFHLRMRLISVRDESDTRGREGNDRTNPCFFAVAVGLEEIETFVPVVIVSVQTIHGRFGCLRTWTLNGDQRRATKEVRKERVALGKL